MKELVIKAKSNIYRITKAPKKKSTANFWKHVKVSDYIVFEVSIKTHENRLMPLATVKNFRNLEVHTDTYNGILKQLSKFEIEDISEVPLTPTEKITREVTSGN